MFESPHQLHNKLTDRQGGGLSTFALNGTLEIHPEEAEVVEWIFERCLAGGSLGKIALGLGQQGIPSPTGRARWNREAAGKLLSNEKYTEF